MIRRTALPWTVLVSSLVAYALVDGVVGRTPGKATATLVLAVTSGLWVVGLVALARLRPGPRLAAALVLGGGLVFGVLALTYPPATSTDVYRYVWDGLVQTHGIDPYRYTPASPRLAHLRPADLFGAPAHCQYRFPGGCTSINRPTVHTIYPPVAEGVFTLVRLLSFGHNGVLAFQVTGLVGSLAVAVLLLRWTAARGRPWLAAVWAWSPVVVTQFVNNAHIDWLGVLFVVIAFATPLVRRPGWAGAVIGAAVATKLYPGVVLPALLRRRPLVVLAAAVGVFVVVYLPHVAAVGTLVIGFLPGYLQQQNYTTGGRELLLGTFLGHPWDGVVGALAVVAAALWAWLRADATRPERAALIVMGVTLFAFTPRNGWYLGIALALVAMTAEFEWLPLCVAGCVAYRQPMDVGRWYYLGSLVIVVAGVAVRAYRARRAAGTTEPATGDRDPVAPQRAP